MNPLKLVIPGCMLAALVACSSSSDSNRDPGPSPEPVGLLTPVTDAAAFATRIKSGLTAMTSDEVLALAGAAEDASFTGTYTQEVGVDELDTVRYDGELLVVAPRRYFQCCFVLNDAAFAPDPPAPPPGAIRILATDPFNGVAEAVGEIPLENGISVQGLYLDVDRMFALTARRFYGSFGQLWADTAIWAPEKLEFKTYDVSDAANPLLEFEATIDGVFVASRRIGNTIYIVSRYTPWLDGLHYYVTTPEQQSANEDVLAAATLEELLPKITIAGEAQLLVQPENCLVTTAPGNDDYSVLTTLIAVPLDNPEAFETTCYNESAYGVYVSPSSLYFAELRPDNLLQRDVTRIHKFALTGTGVAYRGSADIEGTVWQGSQADFRLSEQNGDLRVLASQFDWGSEDIVDHELFILRESTASPNLEILARLPNARRPEEIGKPNEALFSVRFLEDRAYAVTFEQIDPLYVIDLSDPADPLLAGRLEVSGVSDFLHPVSDDLLLGLGREIPGGVKLELFDTSDVSLPQSRGRVVIGGPGSHSEALYDRHAFTYQADSAGADRIAVPANLFESDGSYQFLGSALYLFEIRNKATPALASLSMVGAVEPPANGTEPEWVERSRAFIHEDTIYYVRNESVWASFWFAPNVVNGPF